MQAIKQFFFVVFALLRPSQQSRSASRSLWYRVRHFLKLDVVMLCGIIMLMCMGLLILYSAGDDQTGLLKKQLLRWGMAFSAMLVTAQFSPSKYKLWTPWLFGSGLILLMAVLILGKIGNGAQRWLSLGLFHFQPSELMKLATPMMLAWYLNDKPLPPNTRDVLICAGLLLLPALLTAKQPDLGTAIMIATAGACVIFLAGIRWQLLAGLFLGAVASSPVLWFFMHNYQRQRVLTFLNPERARLGNGYHIIQSKIAIGSGGLLGKGWLHGTQSQLHFLPEHTTDFIFAVCAEELGLLGCLVLLGLYLFVAIRGLRIATSAATTYGKLLAGSLSLSFFMLVFVNIGMVTGILPVVGIPLPLVSYGGTSIVTLLAGFGIVMSIHANRTLVRG